MDLYDLKNSAVLDMKKEIKWVLGVGELVTIWKTGSIMNGDIGQ